MNDDRKFEPGQRISYLHWECNDTTFTLPSGTLVRGQNNVRKRFKGTILSLVEDTRADTRLPRSHRGVIIMVQPDPDHGHPDGGKNPERLVVSQHGVKFI